MTPFLALLFLARQDPQTEILVLGSSTKISVQVDGKDVAFSGAPPQRVRGRVLVPLRGVMEAAGATVQYDPATRTVSASKGDRNLTLLIGSAAAVVNGKPTTLDVPAMIVAETTMVPLRFMGEALGAKVTYRELGPPNNAAMAGVWYLLDSEDKFVKTTKITFARAGTFLFQGSAWKSQGTFEYRDQTVTLIWTSVDGKAVSPPGSMRKTLAVTDSDSRMQLDRFRYGKS